MPLRTGHREHDLVRYQTPKTSELPTQPVPTNAASVERKRMTKHDANRLRWLRATGFAKLDKDGSFYPHARFQREFAETEIRFMEEFCGGYVAPGAQRLIGNASFQQALAGFFFERAAVAANANDLVLAEKWALLGSKLGDYARTNFATAKEQAYKDALAMNAMSPSKKGGVILDVEPIPEFEPGPELERQMKTFPRAGIRDLAVEVVDAPAPTA